MGSGGFTWLMMRTATVRVETTLCAPSVNRVFRHCYAVSSGIVVRRLPELRSVALKRKPRSAVFDPVIPWRGARDGGSLFSQNLFFPMARLEPSSAPEDRHLLLSGMTRMRPRS